MKPFSGAVVSLLLFAFAACQTSAPPRSVSSAEVESITASIDSLLDATLAGATTADAEAVLRGAEGVDSLTMIIGDVVLGGFDPILARFRESYSAIESQSHTVVERQIRVLGPSVALVLLTGEGDYTDTAGWTSEPVGIGLTLVLIREEGRWRITHVHQSIIG